MCGGGGGYILVTSSPNINVGRLERVFFFCIRAVEMFLYQKQQQQHHFDIMNPKTCTKH